MRGNKKSRETGLQQRELHPVQERLQMDINQMGAPWRPGVADSPKGRQPAKHAALGKGRGRVAAAAWGPTIHAKYNKERTPNMHEESGKEKESEAATHTAASGRPQKARPMVVVVGGQGPSGGSFSSRISL